jgi:small subunit ribosomal protein S16
LDGQGRPGHTGAVSAEEQATMVTIRLTRRGGKKEPFYHVVVTDSRRTGGTALEQVGFYNPVARGGSEELRLDLDRIDYWLARGAQASERVAHLVKGQRARGAAAA